MLHETISRQPQEGTDKCKVFQVIKGGIPVWDTGLIVQETELPRRQVSVNIGNLRRDGYLPRPTSEQSKKSRQQAESRELFFLVQPYRGMGMGRGEVILALLMEHGKAFSPQEVSRALSSGVRGNSIRQLSSEEIRDIARCKTMPTEDSANMVSNWLEVRDWLTKQSIPFPVDRLGWESVNNERMRSVSRFLGLRGIPMSDISKYRQFGYKEISMSDEEKSYTFAAKCLNRGLIGEDLSRWSGLNAVYKVFRRELPANFPDRIRLEVFLSALHGIKNGNLEIMESYNSIGREIGLDWFQKSLSPEEEYLSGLTGNSNTPKIGEDERGLYRVDEDGARWREPLGSNGNIVHGQSLPDRSFDVTGNIRDESRNGSLKKKRQGRRPRGMVEKYSSIRR